MKRWSNGLRILVMCSVIGGCGSTAPKAGDAPPPGAVPPPAAPLPIAGIHWKLVQLENEPLSIPDSPREPHFILQDGRATGSGGCNRLSGTYTWDGKHLRFSAIVATKMFCPDAMDFEQPLFDVLNATGSWRLIGKQLELFNAGGAPLARFEARSYPAK